METAEQKKALKARFHVAKHQRKGNFAFKDFDEWYEAVLTAAQGKDPLKCRVNYNDDGTIEVKEVRGGKGPRASAEKPPKPAKARPKSPETIAIETAVVVARTLEDQEVSMEELEAYLHNHEE
jgi:hypothetical protein